jgi:hypothetical protein
MSGRRSRDKGARTERAVGQSLSRRGRGGRENPALRAAGGRFSSDLTVPILGRDVKVEVKCRAEGFRQLYEWLGAGKLRPVIKRRPASPADGSRPCRLLPIWRGSRKRTARCASPAALAAISAMVRVQAPCPLTSSAHDPQHGQLRDGKPAGHADRSFGA